MINDLEKFKCGLCGKEKNILFEDNKGLNCCSDCLELNFSKKDSKFKEKRKSVLDKIKKNELKDYREILLESIKNEDNFEGILKYLPDFYTLISNINSSNQCAWHTKMLVNCALSYLVLEKDIIPDKEGAKGYLDDLYLCVYVLKEIRDNISKNIILENLQNLVYREDILLLISEVFDKSSFYLGKECEKIINFVGLNKFTMFDLVYLLDESYHLKKAKEKQKIIYAMLAIKSNQIFKSPKLERKISHLKEYICSHPDFIEINRYMQYLEK